MSKKERQILSVDTPVSVVRHLIEETVNECEALLDVRLTIHDVSAIFRDPEGQGLMCRERGIHRHPCCLGAKKYSDSQCRKECQQYANRHCRETGQPWVHTCWAGLDEVVVPIMKDNAHVFTIFIGTFRAAGKTSLRFGRAYRSLRGRALPLPPTLMRQARSIVTTLGQGLLAHIENVHKLHQGMEGRKGAVRRFLNYHAHESVGLDDVAAVLNLSRSRTSHLVTELFGMSFKSLLLKERLTRARMLLLSSNDWPVAAIGHHVGLPDEYHFNRAFKKMFGAPPGRFRRENEGN